MAIIVIVLLVLGFVAFLAAASGRFSPREIHLIAIGLALWILTAIIHSI